MTKKYLDSTGLQYFWNSIKPKIIGGKTWYCEFQYNSASAYQGDNIAANCAGFVLEPGASISLKLSCLDDEAIIQFNANITLNVNSTGAKPIKFYYGNEVIDATSHPICICNPSVLQFCYDGSSWICHSTFIYSVSSQFYYTIDGTCDGVPASDFDEVLYYSYGKLESASALASSYISTLATSHITSGTFSVARGGTGKATHTANAILSGNGTSAVNNIATASGALYATAANGAATFGTLPVAQGGTGSTTLTANAILAGNGTSAVKKIATASGAFYATAANGAASFGTLPIAQGGTGGTGISSVTTVSNVITTNSNATISAASYQAWGKVAMVLLTFKTAAALGANATLNIGTIVSGKRPKVAAHGGYQNLTASMTSAGAITIRNCTTASIANTTTLYVSFTYLLA